MTFRKLKIVLESNGWKVIRIVGSHYQFGKEGNSNTITVPYHHKDISMFILKNLEKQTGLSLRR